MPASRSGGGKHDQEVDGGRARPLLRRGRKPGKMAFTLKAAGERRILITKWLGAAWHKLNTNYPKYREKLFYKTGLLMTADGSEDHRIKPEGFENYTF